MSEKTRFLVIDDHPIIAEAINLFLQNNMQNMELDRAEGGKEGIALLKKNKYDLIILDVNLPDYNVLSLIPNVFKFDREAKILIFTMSPENIMARRLFSMNVSGFLSKSVPNEEILRAIKVILNGGKYISNDFSNSVITDFLSGNKHANPFEELSDREYQIMMELLDGRTVREISEKLHLHGSSVSTYRQRIFDKVGVANNLELFKKAQLFGIAE